MEAETDPVREKVAELASLVVSGCSRIGQPLPESTARLLVQRYASITPPEHKSVLQMVTMSVGGRGGGASVKPGNIRLDIRHLVTGIASGVLTVVGVVQAPWTAIFGALVIWDSLYAGARIELSESDASVLWTLWLLCDDKHTMAEIGLLAKVNAERGKYGRVALTQQDLDDSLQRLTRIQSIERADDESRWWLREWVRVNYE